MHVQEDIVASLIDFLVAPHATTTVLLAEKEVWLLLQKMKKKIDFTDGCCFLSAVSLIITFCL